MNEIILTPRQQPEVWIEAEVVKPDVFAGKGLRDIEALEIFCGNKKAKLGDFFEISGETSDKAGDIRIIIAGDVSRTKRVGEEMGAGEILIKGNVGMYVGARMKGGRIIVEEDADAFAAQQLVDGELIIKGNAGNYLGSSYRGDWRGMKGGTIVVEGSAGSEIAEFMLGGKIHIKGNCGAFAGLHMKKGLIVVEGSAARVGAQMTGGSIVVNGRVASLLPGFKFEKKEENIKIDGKEFRGTYSKYTGDHAERGARGVLYVRE